MQALGCLEGITSDLACAQGGAGSAGVRESRAKEFESSGSMILWRTELGTTYYIFVFGSPDDEMGTFEMTVTTKDDPEIVNPADSGRKLQHLSSLVVYIIIAITTGLMACFGQF